MNNVAYLLCMLPEDRFAIFQKHFSSLTPLPQVSKKSGVWDNFTRCPATSPDWEGISLKGVCVCVCTGLFRVLDHWALEIPISTMAHFIVGLDSQWSS